MSAAEEPEVVDAWWTEPRDKAFHMLQSGWPKTQVAETLGVTRQTVINWSQHAKFLDRMEATNADRHQTTKQRRSVETALMTDKLARMAQKTLDQSENPSTGVVDPAKLRTALDALAGYRAMREEERTNSGENVQHHDVHVSGQVSHRHSVAATNFKGFLTEQMKRLAIDVDAEVTGESGQEALIMLTERSIAESDVLDAMVDEEAAFKQHKGR